MFDQQVMLILSRELRSDRQFTMMRVERTLRTVNFIKKGLLYSLKKLPSSILLIVCLFLLLLSDKMAYKWTILTWLDDKSAE